MREIKPKYVLTLPNSTCRGIMWTKNVECHNGVAYLLTRRQAEQQIKTAKELGFPVVVNVLKPVRLRKLKCVK